MSQKRNNPDTKFYTNYKYLVQHSLKSLVCTQFSDRKEHPDALETRVIRNTGTAVCVRLLMIMFKMQIIFNIHTSLSFLF